PVRPVHQDRAGRSAPSRRTEADAPKPTHQSRRTRADREAVPMTSASADVRAIRAVADNAWVRFAARRLGRLVVSVWVLVTAAFLMIHLIPGDPVRAALDATAPLELVDAGRQALGHNDPRWLHE